MDNLFYKARNVDLVHYLASLGYRPKRETDRIAYYISPKRDENHPSFEVNKVYNSWSDWGEEKAYGSPIDFVMWMQGCDVKEAAEMLVNEEAIPQYHKPPRVRENEKAIDILQVEEEISNKALINYLEQQRKIPMEIANKYCKQLLFQFATSKHTKHYGIGFENDKRGWAVRNTWWKGACAPASVSTVNFENGLEVILLEGFMDFLSYVRFYGQPEHTCIVLNSLIFIPMIVDVLHGYDKCHLWLDNDGPADDKLEYLLAHDIPVVDHRDEFRGYNDLNEKLQVEMED